MKVPGRLGHAMATVADFARSLSLLDFKFVEKGSEVYARA